MKQDESPLKFEFKGRWKEQLVCSCSLGSFVLEMPMGIMSVYLPTAHQWELRAPEWARPHWDELHKQLGAWCSAHNWPLYIDGSASVYAL
jgi:hypothetical protein